MLLLTLTPWSIQRFMMAKNINSLHKMFKMTSLLELAKNMFLMYQSNLFNITKLELQMISIRCAVMLLSNATILRNQFATHWTLTCPIKQKIHTFRYCIVSINLWPRDSKPNTWLL